MNENFLKKNRDLVFKTWRCLYTYFSSTQTTTTETVYSTPNMSAKKALKVPKQLYRNIRTNDILLKQLIKLLKINLQIHIGPAKQNF